MKSYFPIICLILYGGLAGAQQMPSKHVLKDVPYVGMEWEKYLSSPEDFTFPSVMRALNVYFKGDPSKDYFFYQTLMGYSYSQQLSLNGWRTGFDNPFLQRENPLKTISDAFWAAGYTWEAFRNQPGVEKNGVTDNYGITDTCNADETRQRVCASLMAGRPVILYGLMYGAAMATGYEDNGNTLIGWGHHDNAKNMPKDENGYIKWPDWLNQAIEIFILTGSEPAPELREIYIKMLQDSVRSMRTAKINEWDNGIASHDTWLEMMNKYDEENEKPLTQRHEIHFMQALSVAEGRAFGGSMLDRMMEEFPEAKDELTGAAGACFSMHDLMWRIWQTAGGIGTDAQKAEKLRDPALREHVMEIIRQVRDLDTLAVAHMARALVLIGADTSDLPPALPTETGLLEQEADITRNCGGDDTMIRHDESGNWIDAVPILSWSTTSCCFMGALEAALAPTRAPYTYSELQGYSGYAFRTRWFHNPDKNDTPDGAFRWHPLSAHAEQQDVLDALTRATGWEFSREELTEANNEADLQRLITHAVNSINLGLPVVAMHNTDLGTIFGYHIHSMSLIFRDFQNWPVESMRFNYDNQKWGSPWVFLKRLNESPTPEDALKFAIGKAISDYNRSEEDYYHYGKDAMIKWMSALDEYENLSPEEQDWLYMVNWWALMHLTDARNQAVKFLQEQRDFAPEATLMEYDKALRLYTQEAKLFFDFIQDNDNCVMWWRGSMDKSVWTEPIRMRQKEIMLQAIPMEAEAMKILQDIVK
jgi:hypothetical protein